MLGLRPCYEGQSMRVAAPVELSPEERTSLERMARQRFLPLLVTEHGGTDLPRPD